MSKLFAVLLSATLMFAGANAYADETMKKETMSNPAMEKGMEQGVMASPVAKHAPKKASLKRKKHHKHKRKHM